MGGGTAGLGVGVAAGASRSPLDNVGVQSLSPFSRKCIGGVGVGGCGCGPGGGASGAGAEREEGLREGASREGVERGERSPIFPVREVSVEVFKRL